MSAPTVTRKVALNGNCNRDYNDCIKSQRPGVLSTVCTTRHVNVGDSVGKCRFSYATWCPACEEHEKVPKFVVGRRRCKSEGMEGERIEDYYYRMKQDTFKNSHYNGRETHTNYYRDVNARIPLSNVDRFDHLRRSPVKVYSYKEEETNPFLSCAPDRRNDNPTNKCRQWLNCCGSDTVKDRKTCCRSWTYNHGQWVGVENCAQATPPLHERYYREVEVLRSKLHELRGSPPDGKRIRQISESDCNSLYGTETGTKRARDVSPTATSTTNRKILPSVPPVPIHSSSVANGSAINAQTDIHGSASSTSLSSDSDFNDSACDEEEDIKTETEGESEGQSSINNQTSSSSSCSPSYIVSNTLGSISLNENVSVKGAVQIVPRTNIHPSLRASLFPHVPPYIKFAAHDTKGVILPAAISRLLKWKLSTITPVVVRRTIMNSNFKLVRKSNDWCGTWGKHMKSINFKTLREYQKINHFPGTFQIGRKDRLWKNLFRLMTKFGKKEFGFIPRTYVLPQDSKLLRSAWEKNCGKERWIVKPPASARGTGIKVIHKWTQIPKKCPLVVQKYIADPYLINGSKFDLRLYVLVTSMNPLRIYMYDNGLVRFASVKYSSEMSTLADRYMHLTNYSINKLSSQYTQNEDASACQGHKWTLRTLWSYLEREHNVDVKSLWASLIDLVIKTVISGESSISQLSRANLVSRYCSYELFGVDILLDRDLKPWLLEVNISPSLHSSSPLDLAVKGPMVKDLMNIAGYQIPNRLSPQIQEDLGRNLGTDAELCYDKRLYTTGLSNAERSKHNLFQQTEVREEYLESILQDLTPDDVRHLIQYEDELTQIGNFQKIFPTKETHDYHQFFEAPRYYNMLFDAWETKQHANRAPGIALLESLCEKQVHLDVTQIPPKRTKVSVSPSELSCQDSTEQLVGLEAQDQELSDPYEEEEVDTPVPSTTDRTRDKWAITVACGAICRAVRPRNGKPGVVTKPFPHSSYISRKSVLRSAKTARVAAS